LFQQHSDIIPIGVYPRQLKQKDIFLFTATSVILPIDIMIFVCCNNSRRISK